MGIYDDNPDIWSLWTHGYLGGELPQGHERAEGNLTAPQQPVLPCAQQISALVER